jgi:hypothetical protein
MAMRFKVLTEAVMSVLAVWAVTLYEFAGRYQHTGEMYCLRLQSRNLEAALKMEPLSSSETLVDIFTAAL